VTLGDPPDKTALAFGQFTISRFEVHPRIAAEWTKILGVNETATAPLKRILRETPQPLSVLSRLRS
jgi:hypothetical protein